MRVIADLHLHSKYSRAVSSKMVVGEIARWAKLKGIDLVGAPDWTHPVWVRELKSQLVEARPGIFQQKTLGRKGIKRGKELLFLLVTELASIYSQGGKGRRIHTLVFAPSFAVVDKINAELARRGVNLMADGRPIMGLSVKEIGETVFSISKECLIVPSHLWTPWFGALGNLGGFESLEEAYGEFAKYIYAIETGLSSDPEMNWRIGELDNRSILSFSDAHSGANLGREATVFETKIKNDNSKFKISYHDIARAIKQSEDSDWQVAHTVEFYPQEGKYHYTGHRNCGVSQSPQQTKRLGTICPVCGRPLTVGVMHRVSRLARHEIKNEKLKMKNDKFGVKWIGYQNRPPYVMLVPLAEIIGEAKGVGKLSKSVLGEYRRLVSIFGSELKVLLETPVEEIAKVSGERLAAGIGRVRSGQVHIEPGSDGVYGRVSIWPKRTGTEIEKKRKQMSLF